MYEVKGSERQFENGFKLLEYYQNNPINYSIDKIGEPVNPVTTTRCNRESDVEHDGRKNRVSWMLQLLRVYAVE